MRSYVLKRFHLDLNMTDLTDETRDELVAGILAVVTTSTLIQGNPALQASVAALGAKSTALKADRDAVSATEQKLAAQIDTANTSRAAVDTELLSLAGLVATRAVTVTDITGAGFRPRPPRPPKPPFAPPDAIDIRFPKSEKGKLITSPRVTGKTRSHWAVQMSVDPFGPTTWVDVVGPGKSRVITGASGTRVWVRYAMVRGATPSAWSTPVLATIP